MQGFLRAAGDLICRFNAHPSTGDCVHILSTLSRWSDDQEDVLLYLSQPAVAVVFMQSVQWRTDISM